MPRGNNAPDSELRSKLLQIRFLIDECLAQLPGRASASAHSVSAKTSTIARSQHKLDFDQPVRPFMKERGRNLSGSKKFVLLLSRMAKGGRKTEIEMKALEKEWNRMKAIMGMPFNRFFPADARDHDWVESQRKGYYNLRPGWMNIFSGRK